MSGGGGVRWRATAPLWLPKLERRVLATLLSRWDRDDAEFQSARAGHLSRLLGTPEADVDLALRHLEMLGHVAKAPPEAGEAESSGVLPALVVISRAQFAAVTEREPMDPESAEHDLWERCETGAVVDLLALLGEGFELREIAAALRAGTILAEVGP